jgi:hypothetical protein
MITTTAVVIRVIVINKIDMGTQGRELEPLS